MLKNILNLEGAQQLSKKQQNTIHGGGDGGLCYDECNYYGGSCPSGAFCLVARCYPDHTEIYYPYGRCITNQQ